MSPTNYNVYKLESVWYYVMSNLHRYILIDYFLCLVAIYRNHHHVKNKSNETNVLYLFGYYIYKYELKIILRWVPTSMFFF